VLFWVTRKQQNGQGFLFASLPSLNSEASYRTNKALYTNKVVVHKLFAEQIEIDAGMFVSLEFLFALENTIDQRCKIAQNSNIQINLIVDYHWIVFICSG